MFQIISAVVIIVIAVSMFVKARQQKAGWSGVLEIKKLKFRESLTEIKLVSASRPASFNRARVAVNTITALLFIIMFISGVVNPLFTGNHITGIILFIHVICAPLFSIALTLSILLWAHQMQFSAKNFEYINGSGKASAKIDFWRKVCFWSFIIVACISIISILLAMFPLLDSVGQDFLLDLHRYSALIMLALIAYYRIIKIENQKA